MVALEAAHIAIKVTAKILEEVMDSETSPSPKKAKLSDPKTIIPSNSDMCVSATQGVGAEKRWRKESSAFYQNVVEAKKRGLSCGVGSTSSAAKTPSICSSINLKVCSDDQLCKRGSRLINGKKIWDQRSKWISYSAEAKKRNLTCGVISSNSTTKLNYTDNYICDRAAPPSNSGIRKWLTTGFIDYKYVVIARKRNLSCGVALTSSTTITSSNNDICVLATQGVGAEKRWRKVSSAFYQNVVEAKKRGLSCGVVSTRSKTKTSSTCSLKNLEVCSNKLLCSRGSRTVNGERLWDERPKWIKYSAEAKKRNLTCGVKAISSTVKVVSACSIKNTKACNDNYVCQFATSGNAGKKAWYKKDQPLYQYVTEAKKRGLKCGVKTISSKTKTSSACSKTNTKTCTDYLLCRFSTINDAGKQVWFESDHIMYPYVIEAKKRNLSCGIKSSG